MLIQNFFRDGCKELLRGGWMYRLWVGLLLLMIAAGGGFYLEQLDQGLVITGLSDQVSWGYYIANFAFLVGIAASAVLLVIPAYIFNRKDIEEVVLLGEAMAVAAVVTAILFVVIDLGRPDRLWHLIPLLGRFHFPQSLLAWDVLVLSGYLVLNCAISFYLLFCHYRGRSPVFGRYFPFVILAMFWAIGIHTVTAFLFSANSARPFWHGALLGPRFIASAFVSGPALLIVALQIIHRIGHLRVNRSVIETLALIMTVSLQISLFFVGAELFTDFYNTGSQHVASSKYLYLGLDGFSGLRPWIWTALTLNGIAVTILMIHPLRRNLVTLNTACLLAYCGVWMEKGMALVVPGFIPTPLGEIFEYLPTVSEVIIATGCWAVGVLLFTLLVKAGAPLELGRLHRTDGEQDVVAANGPSGGPIPTSSAQ
ncbi:MAG: polysulfide reductase NrfD [Gammaproteobacteria bacterium]|nr:polysulfide reductase NrfD [Gammaproteobacteria bacterium]MCP5424240.1 polysulfide reductase NrfD [Gammaproteobacteria bacterium]MCP5458886.1 polysulfide reductase NrfD [Gammaproteobacteria bacterium]